ncbi:hypothetical protein D3C85_1400910 [compost metagenome]
MRDEGAAANCATIARGCYQGHFRYCALADIPQIHQGARLQPDRFQQRFELDVGVQLLRVFIARTTHISCPDQHNRHPIVDTRHLDALEAVNGISGR